MAYSIGLAVTAQPPRQHGCECTLAACLIWMVGAHGGIYLVDEFCLDLSWRYSQSARRTLAIV